MTKSRVDWKSWLTKAILFLILLVVVAAVIFAIVVSFGKFLQVALPVLAFVTGISWAVRTTNLHQYKRMEKNVETYIYLYEYTDSRKKKQSYKLIIENYDRTSKYFVDSIKLFSYMSLYFLFSVIFLFTSEMFVLIYNSPLYCCTFRNFYISCSAVGLAILSGLFFVFACVALFIYLRINREKECKFKRYFKAFSACFAKYTVILQENWIEFYRQEDWRKLYHKISEGNNWGVFEKREELSRKLTPSGEDIERVIWNYDWLVDLLKSD